MKKTELSKATNTSECLCTKKLLKGWIIFHSHLYQGHNKFAYLHFNTFLSKKIPSRELTYPTSGKENHLQNCNVRGYVSSLKGKLPPWNPAAFQPLFHPLKSVKNSPESVAPPPLEICWHPWSKGTIITFGQKKISNKKTRCFRPGGCQPKNRGKNPPNHPVLIGFSIIFTIHFGVPLFLETPRFCWYGCDFFKWKKKKKTT